MEYHVHVSLTSGQVLIITLVAMMLSSFILCQGTSAADEVTLQLSWRHQSQFAGFYAADQLKYYAEEDLTVAFLPRSKPGSNTIAALLDGPADFSITNGAALVTARSQGHAIVAVATIYRRHPLAFLTLAGSGITRPHDFPGHTIRALTPTGTTIYQAMMTRLGLDPNSVRSIDAGFDMTPFFTGDVDIWPGFITDEALNAREQGYELNEILPGDYGIHLYGDTVFTTNRLLRENPDLALRFLRATLKGWRWAIENPTEAASLSLHYNLTLDKTHEVRMMEAIVPLIHTGRDRIGWMRPEIWQQTHDILLKQGILEQPIDIHAIYSMQFLQRIYREKP
jgi:NitT/TauT family transport system substrate-binding protein